ncbi:MAG: polyphosphate polymerase domain-containing protein [Clostridiaceae bacterium]|nr:polyphosphate polymerase domain-containing protein [Clostridiaceae bacterium]
MKFRHEYKFDLNYSDYLITRGRLKAVLPCDENGGEMGEYHVRSIYFDTPQDKVLREKIDGVDRREKFRMRIYNLDASNVKLEKKSKINGLGYKESAVLTKEQANAILSGDTGWMANSDNQLILELYAKMKNMILRPKTIVEYIREPFVHPAGNTRITLDRNLRTGICRTDALTFDAVTIPARDEPIILEVKYDEFLPQIVRDIIQLEGRRAGAFSKYAACRVYG